MRPIPILLYVAACAGTAGCDRQPSIRHTSGEADRRLDRLAANISDTDGSDPRNEALLPTPSVGDVLDSTPPPTRRQ